MFTLKKSLFLCMLQFFLINYAFGFFFSNKFYFDKKIKNYKLIYLPARPLSLPLCNPELIFRLPIESLDLLHSESSNSHEHLYTSHCAVQPPVPTLGPCTVHRTAPGFEGPPTGVPPHATARERASATGRRSGQNGKL